jgi:phospholipid/cholesterol/gamma-HCH transport system substrate-binding protein
LGEVLLSRQTFTRGRIRAKLTGSLMETRAPYALIGFFVLAIVGGVFGFVYWLHNTGGLGERTVYRVRFENTVSGLLTGAPVLFNGIRVGEVTSLSLDPGNPRQVTATIAVVSTTPVRTDTQVGLEYQGLTGVPVVSLLGGTSAARPLSPSPTEPPILVADPAAGQSMTEAARQALRRIDSVLADNSDPLKSAIANLNTFAAALARNSDRVDTILAGLERATGGGSAKTTVPKYYDLATPRTFPPSDKAAKGQLVVLEPTALIALDTQRIIIEVGTAETAGSNNAQWSDSIPKLLQAKIVQSFENSNYLGAVARPMEGLTADYQLAIDVRSFQVSNVSALAEQPAAGSMAHVAFAAKILADNGRIIGSRTFDALVPAPDLDAAAAAAAIDKAFARAVTDLIVWTAGLI